MTEPPKEIEVLLSRRSDGSVKGNDLSSLPTNQEPYERRSPYMAQQSCPPIPAAQLIDPVIDNQSQSYYSASGSHTGHQGAGWWYSRNIPNIADEQDSHAFQPLKPSAVQGCSDRIPDGNSLSRESLSENGERYARDFADSSGPQMRRRALQYRAQERKPPSLAGSTTVPKMPVVNGNNDPAWPEQGAVARIDQVPRPDNIDRFTRRETVLLAFIALMVLTLAYVTISDRGKQVMVDRSRKIGSNDDGGAVYVVQDDDFLEKIVLLVGMAGIVGIAMYNPPRWLLEYVQ